MSYSTFLGAVAIPPDTPDPYGYSDELAPQFRGSSRSGWFQRTSGHLLNALPGHEALRFLSAEAQTREVNEGGGRMAWTLLGNQTAAVALVELEGLIEACAARPQLLAERVFHEYGNANAGQVSDALREARECRELNRQAPHGEDGDSLEFFFSVLLSLRATLRAAGEKSLVVVFFNWLPS